MNNSNMEVFPLQAGVANRHRSHKVIGAVEVEGAVALLEINEGLLEVNKGSLSNVLKKAVTEDELIQILPFTVNAESQAGSDVVTVVS